LALFTSFGDGVSAKLDEVGSRGEVGRREKFWGKKKVEKTNNFG